MTISKELQDRVMIKVAQTIGKAERYFKREFKIPEVTYNVRGNTAGKADSHKWLIMLNEYMMNEHTEEMINQTVPHEIAHLITDKVYGNLPQHHSKEWQSVMFYVFGLQPDRCHSMMPDPTNKFRYACECQYYFLTKKEHTNVVRGWSKYSCPKCRAVMHYQPHDYAEVAEEGADLVIIGERFGEMEIDRETWLHFLMDTPIGKPLGCDKDGAYHPDENGKSPYDGDGYKVGLSKCMMMRSTLGRLAPHNPDNKVLNDLYEIVRGNPSFTINSKEG